MTSAAVPLWAKIGARDAAGKPLEWHALVDHGADVAAVFEAMLRVPLVAARMARLANVHELDPCWASRLACFVYLHDFGKANRGFRKRWHVGADGVGHIATAVGLLRSARLQGRLLASLPFEEMFRWGAESEALPAVLAHHGRPVDLQSPEGYDHLWREGPDSDPVADLAILGAEVRTHWPEAFTSDGIPLPPSGPFWHAISGLTMLADWIGSDTQHFPLASGQACNRMAWARKRAPDLLRRIGFDPAARRSALTGAVTFGSISPWPSRPAQEAVGGVPGHTVIFESETGSGKTEAALYRFAKLFAAGEVDGLYFALPTRVAASSLFERVKETVKLLFPEASRPPVVLAVPGYARADDAGAQMLPNFDVLWDDAPEAAQRQERWAAERPKRFLAGTIAVGTIDQALLGAIQIKHAHMRSACLLRHLLVVDEVHASDNYMEQLLMHLLQLHRAAGGHSLLLSATLGAAARTRLLHGMRSTRMPALATAEAQPYPAISTDVAPEPVLQVGTGREKHVSLHLDPAIGDPAAIAAMALAAAQAGAKVLVVRNLQRDAVVTAEALFNLAPNDPVLFRCNGVVTLHHGRFALEDRVLLDAAVARDLGPDRPRGGKIVVGSQTLEQSLDIDADLIITDLCPADVLLQRLGRLHRHADRGDRAAGFREPRAVILSPADLSQHLGKARLDRHGIGGEHGPYADLLAVEATRRLIGAHPVWVIPAMNRLLVERTTHPEALDALSAELSQINPLWGKSDLTTQGRRLMAQQVAKDAGIPWHKSFLDFQFPANEERLATRLGARDLTVMFEAPLPAGPFERPIKSLSIPSFWLQGIDPGADVTPKDIGDKDGRLSFIVQTTRFYYDHLGLRRERNAQREGQ